MNTPNKINTNQVSPVIKIRGWSATQVRVNKTMTALRDAHRVPYTTWTTATEIYLFPCYDQTTAVRKHDRVLGYLSLLVEVTFSPISFGRIFEAMREHMSDVTLQEIVETGKWLVHNNRCLPYEVTGHPTTEAIGILSDR